MILFLILKLQTSNVTEVNNYCPISISVNVKNHNKFFLISSMKTNLDIEKKIHDPSWNFFIAEKMIDAFKNKKTSLQYIS